MKQRLNVSVDADVYLLAKAADVNLSDLISKLLRQYFQTSEPHQKEADLLDAIDVKRRKIDGLQEELSRDTVLLVQLREKQQKQSKDTMDEAERQWRSFRNSGVMEELP